MILAQRQRYALLLVTHDHRIFDIAVAQVLNKRGADEFSMADEERFREFLIPLGRLLGDILLLEHSSHPGTK